MKLTEKQTEALARARDLIARGWCRNAIAKDGDGVICAPSSPTAVAWCALGAIRAAAAKTLVPDGPLIAAVVSAARIEGDKNGWPVSEDIDVIGYWNDCNAWDREDVLLAFDRAAARAGHDRAVAEAVRLPAVRAARPAEG